MSESPAYTRCPLCFTDLQPNAKYCFGCGWEVDSTVALDPARPHSSDPDLHDPHLTVTLASGHSPGAPPRPADSGRASNGTAWRSTQPPLRSAERFAPGTLLAGRYRIVSRLGKGGMGEVFRAEDIVLGQAVALKFLPAESVRNVNLLKRFYEEVRIARQISHPNVCRVYDIGEIEGQPYLSMEYIDGEDLSGLLRRIGRLPADKALEFARKLCSGLAAAHAQGILHRDLKPANIMIDGRGQPRITDFGLAGVAAELTGAEVRNGTPAYMAPEQLEGTEVSLQSDIYALGLVFYEMFTGQLPHKASTIAEMLELRKESSTSNPSELVDGIDPAIGAAILRCLEPEPKQRPSSAMSLAAMLPGGDPLAAALAAGETPSPDLVAASGAHQGMRPRTAMAVVASVIAGLVALLLWIPRIEMMNRVPRQNPPEVLHAKALDAIHAFGYSTQPADEAEGFWVDDQSAVENYLADPKHRAQVDNALAMGPYAVAYWYRQSPTPLSVTGVESDGVLKWNDPPESHPGMISARVDLQGRLLRFHAIPKQLSKPASSVPEPDWNRAFALAGLDPSRFTAAEPEWTPRAVTDQRRAWTGTYPGLLNIPIRVEAAAFQGKLVYFDIIWPWTTSVDPPETPETAGFGDWARRIALLLIFLIAISAMGIARWNWKAGRGDRKGAYRLGLALFVIAYTTWLLKGHVGGVDQGINMFDESLAGSLYDLFTYWVLYLAIEPWVRRHWPQALISWTRLLQGKWKDPVVGRDLLVGVALGTLYALILMGPIHLESLNRGIPATLFNPDNWSGTRAVLGLITENLQDSVMTTLVFFLMLFLLRVGLRNTVVAGIVFALIMVAVNSGDSAAPWIEIPMRFGLYSLIVLSMVRFGFFASSVMVLVFNLLLNAVMTTDFSAWYGQSSWATLVLILALVAWGYRTTLAGRPVFS